MKSASGGLSLLALAIAVAPPSAAAQAARVHTSSIRSGSDTYERRSLGGRNGVAVDYFISRPAGRQPLILYIQGSGCAPAFFETQPGQYASTIFSLTTVAHRPGHAVMVADKPFAPSRPPRGGGLATDCPDAFNRSFSLETWVAALDAALRDAMRRPWVRPGRILVIGISEGATAAAALAARNPAVTDVALVGGSGPSQLYDFVAAAYAGSGTDAGRLKAIEGLQAQLAEIRADPDDWRKFAWGHSYKRWSSFFRASSVDNLRRSKARIYLVSGMADASVPILSTEVIWSELAPLGRDIRFRRIPGADHALVPAGSDFGHSFPQIEAEFAAIVDWFDAGPDAASARPRQGLRGR